MDDHVSREVRANLLKELKSLNRKRHLYEFVGGGLVVATSIGLILGEGPSLSVSIGLIAIGLQLSIMGAVYSLWVAAEPAKQVALDKIKRSIDYDVEMEE